MDQEKSTGEKAEELEAEALEERERAQNMLEHGGSVLQSVDLKIDAVRKEREAVNLEREALREDEEHLDEHPDSSVPLFDEKEERIKPG